jgi:hypothetical protein
MFKIGEKVYLLNIDAIIEYITKSDDSTKNVNTQTVNHYRSNDSTDASVGTFGGELVYVGKEVSEDKHTKSETIDTIRYDLIKSMIETLLNISFDGDEDDLTSITFGEKIIFNSFIEKGFLKEKE